MTESTVAFTRDWRGDHVLAERILRTLSERSVGTLLHFGKYGAQLDGFGRSWYAERVENLCFEHGVQIWIASSDEGTQAWAMSRSISDAGDRPQPVLPGLGERQLMLQPGHVSQGTIETLEQLASVARIGIVDLDKEILQPDWANVIL